MLRSSHDAVGYVQGSRSRRRRRSAKVSGGLSLTIVPVQASRQGTSVKGRKAVWPGSGLGGWAEAEAGLVDPHPVENDTELASLRDLSPLAPY